MEWSILTTNDPFSSWSVVLTFKKGRCIPPNGKYAVAKLSTFHLQISNCFANVNYMFDNLSLSFPGSQCSCPVILPLQQNFTLWSGLWIIASFFVLSLWTKLPGRVGRAGIRVGLCPWMIGKQICPWHSMIFNLFLYNLALLSLMSSWHFFHCLYIVRKMDYWTRSKSVTVHHW